MINELRYTQLFLSRMPVKRKEDNISLMNILCKAVFSWAGYSVVNVKRQEHDRVQTESQEFQTWTAVCFDLVGSHQNGSIKIIEQPAETPIVN